MGRGSHYGKISPAVTTTKAGQCFQMVSFTIILDAGPTTMKSLSKCLVSKGYEFQILADEKRTRKKKKQNKSVGMAVSLELLFRLLHLVALQ